LHWVEVWSETCRKGNKWLLNKLLHRFGEDVMDTMLRFTVDQTTASFRDKSQADLSILDIGTGNGVLPLELASLGHSRVTGEQEAIQAPVQRRAGPAV